MFKYFQKAFRKILKKIYIKYIILLSSFKKKTYLNKVVIDREVFFYTLF